MCVVTHHERRERMFESERGCTSVRGNEARIALTTSPQIFENHKKKIRVKDIAMDARVRWGVRVWACRAC